MTDKHSQFRARDPLDDIDETVAQITDEHIEARLRETLHRAGRSPAPREDDDDALAKSVVIRLPG
jgi:hypothetical protein